MSQEAMAENQTEIQIRSLSGESTTLSIPSNRSIQDLKLLLKLIFAPAKNTQTFHLFFKGDKMKLSSSISSYSVGREDFIIMVPYKKDTANKSISKVWDRSSTPSKTSSSAAAESIWSDLMQDISERNQHAEEIQENGVLGSSSSNLEETQRDETRSRLIEDVINSSQSSKSKSVLDETGYEKIALFSYSMNCMCDRKTGKCLSAAILDLDSEKSCQCPIWLKKLLKVFSFLNIFSGFLLTQRLELTWDRLKGAMMNLGRFGLEVGIEDVKHLLVVCPKIVRTSNHEGEPIKLGDSIIIVDSTNVEDQSDSANFVWTVRKHASNSTVANTIKKREIAFKENLFSAFRKSMILRKRKYGNATKMLSSFEELLELMKDSDTAARCGEAKRTKTNSCGTLSSQSRKTNCRDTKPLLPAEMVDHLRKGIGSLGQIVHIEEINARTAVHVDIPKELSDSTQSALRRIGVSKLYSHQAESIQASLSGKDVVVATMTSSGKSLCYNVPVLESLSQNLLSCALYLFPTKALAQDQKRALSAMTEGMDTSFNVGLYDGDTPQEDRRWLRNNSRLLITNPDMLHMSILPFHTQFNRILSNLRFVVIDEAHTYKGAFGCHTAFIIRRLRRLCNHVYGTNPTFIFCTATSANPREHAMELAGLPELHLIQNDGSPSSSKLFALWNPFQIHAEPQVLKTPSQIGNGKASDNNRHPSPLREISNLFAEMVQHGLRCIAFCSTRKCCELVLSYTREILQETAPSLVDSICSYRAGYMAEERRRIEGEFFSGKLRGVAATNALELGIDVGCIDATLHLGFPGSVASLWQQAGRSGRREKPSLSVYVAFESPLDQYFMKFPQKLFRRPIECCLVDSQNKQVLGQHLLCAALEHPLSLVHDERYFGPGLNWSINSSTLKGQLSSNSSRGFSTKMWSYIGHEKRPSYGISIRAIEKEKYQVINRKTNKVIEEIEESKAFFQVYEGAVYLQQGKTYLVTDLDIFDKIAKCEEADLKYYTQTCDHTNIDVCETFAYPVTQYLKTAQSHSCKVTTEWFGFYRFMRGRNEILDGELLSLPVYSYESQAVWIRVPESIREAVEGQNYPAGLHAASHAVLNVVPLFLQCNSSDLASECDIPHENNFSFERKRKVAHVSTRVPDRILLYDQHPGGSGVSVQVQQRFRELLIAALELLTTCLCSDESGCPSCVQAFSCREHNSCLHKNAAIIILKGVIEFIDSK
ncbi:hypothetical protein ACHQM5_008871 [Ranunculus cassubicifolius]